MKKLIVVLLCLNTGCGGGSSDGSFFAGIWRGVLVITENSCEGSLEPVNVELTVNQVDTEIAIQSSSGNNYVGAVDGDNSFFASRQEDRNCINTKTGAVVPDSFTTQTSTYRFSNVDGDQASIQLTHEFSNCSGNTIANVACRLTLEGAGSRTDQ